MSMNPRDYDLDELRKMARERGRAEGDGDSEIGISAIPTEDTVAGGDSFRASLYRELLPLSAAMDDGDKPYLSTLPDHYAAEHLVFEWLEFLLLHAGFKGATEAIAYYEDVEWITADVADDLEDYLLGIDDRAANEDNDLDIDDHLLSLVYVAKLATMA